MATMNVMTIMAAMPLMTKIALMATMTNDHCQCDSLNNYESCYIRDVFNNSVYGYGHNGSSGHNRCNGHIDCYEYIVVMTKHLLVVFYDSNCGDSSVMADIALLTYLTCLKGVT